MDPITTTILALALFGVRGTAARLTVTVRAPGAPFALDGATEPQTRETGVRVRCALHALGLPPVTIRAALHGVAPRWFATGVDLPIALATARGLASGDPTTAIAALGELSLDGRVRPVRGVFPLVEAAADAGARVVFVPTANEHEARAAARAGLDVVPVATLQQAIDWCEGAWTPAPAWTDLHAGRRVAAVDWAEIRRSTATDEVEAALARGARRILLVGPPGAGKSMIARRMASLLPPMTEDERRDTLRIRSAAGLTREDEGLPEPDARPFRAPHHTISDVALVGGGSTPRPGEISLAHAGVLFLDEIPEFRRSVVEVLRPALESGEVGIPARDGTRGTVRIPARPALLVAAACPCPCGHKGFDVRECRCTEDDVARFRARIPLDLFDAVIEVPPVPFAAFPTSQACDRSAVVRERIAQARAAA